MVYPAFITLFTPPYSHTSTCSSAETIRPCNSKSLYINMASSKAAQKRKKMGMAMQLPPHVQTNLNKEARLLQQSLEDLEKKTRHRLSCIIRDQQVAGIKLQSLQIRLVASQSKSYSLQSQSPGPSKPIPGAGAFRGMAVTIKKSQSVASTSHAQHSDYHEAKGIAGNRRRASPKGGKTVSFS